MLPKALLANAQHETTNDALFRLDQLAAHLDRLGSAVADLDQDRRLKAAALHIMLDAIAVFAWSELRGHPLHCVHAQPRALNVLMEPVSTYAAEPTILPLVNSGTGLALIGADGRLDSMVPRARRFVFALPARERLEAGPSVIGIVPN